MKQAVILFAMTTAIGTAAFSQAHPASPASSPAQIQTRVEAYLRDLYAWDSAFQVKVETPTESGVSGLLKVPVDITYKGQVEHATVYVSQDGRFLLRGELNDMLSDPFADVRSHLHLDGNPSLGPTNAAVTVVIFSDFQCPACRQLYQTLKAVEPMHPQVRFVFKDFPLEQIHPWAMTAALAGRCAYSQNPPSFWKVHDAIFINQADINPTNAWDKMLELASQAGLDLSSFRGCMASDDAKQAVQANLADGTAVHITSTPTVFVNGRALTGAQKDSLEQYITYEVNARKHK